MARRWMLVVATAVATVFVVAGCAPQLPFPQQAAPAPSTAWVGGPQFLETVDPAWVARTAKATGIPQTAMLAYASAAIASSNVAPECGLGWNTLAAIGLVESDHGRHDGSVVQPDGRVDPPIFGVVLDGGDTANIPDTDGGEFDGDAQHDRAMGPMQIIPQTWRSWPIDGSGDNVPDPQNILDAAFSAANYLCHASGGMSTPEGWRAGIAAYNAGDQYLARVASTAQRYLDEASG